MYQAMKTVYESMVKPSDSPEMQIGKAIEFGSRFRVALGLTENEYGRPTIDWKAPEKRDPRAFSFEGLAHTICGYEWHENLKKHVRNGSRVFEAGGNPAITPGSIPNVSAFLGSVTGLLDHSILEGYEAPEFIIDSIVETRPVNTRQTSIIGLGQIGNVSTRRNPGDPYNFAQFQERYIRTPETQQDALGCAVTVEAVAFDQTTQVLDRCRSIGRVLARQKEFDGWRVVVGATNPYVYNGTGYNTYVASGGNWVNKVASNALADWTNINVIDALFSRMTDQETGNRIAVNWDTLICSPTKKMTARYIQAATTVQARTPTTMAVVSQSGYLGDEKRLLSSPYLDQILTAATTANPAGLAETQSRANEYYYCLKTGRGGAFYRNENWPMMVKTAMADSYTMLANGIFMAIFANQMHVFGVQEPRFVVWSYDVAT